MHRSPTGRRPGQDATHLDLLQIDALRAGEASEEKVAHAAACDSCASLLSTLSAIAADMRAVAPPPVLVPQERERHILWTAKKQAATVRRRRMPTTWRVARIPFVGWAAAAVAVLAIASLLARRPLPEAEVPLAKLVSAPLSAGDVDGDSRLTILDAFALARAIEGASAAPRWDVNSDQAVDRSDVNMIAAMAVSLGGR